ncbi:ABC transporter substrate-binding protein [Rhodococcus sp. HNM0569]|uniref:ABC transporter substrate-binding protein n=1 Tax=Rhodococcus sp. HNM0569 TaxID=2716340 RepID=UPI00146E52B4|nr:ABC transporter substrate-binding protein [Rhodococcus sp. HNM0569]NLU84389.1 ABC transporter substrate-binding protein [Rhodococcus sp. HNM0569]
MNLSFTHRARHVLTAVVGAAVVASTLAACSSSDAASADGLTPVKIGAPWNGTAGKTPADTGPFGYAVERGLAQPILQKYGFDYDGFVGFNNGPPVVQALQTGDIQVGLIGDTPAVQARASSIDVPAVFVAKPNSDIWFLGREGGVSRIEDLAGKKVALQFGSNFDKYGRAVLERAGVVDKVELVNMLFADALPALQRGDVDAVPLPATTAGIWRKQADFPILSKASLDDPDLLATSVGLTSRATLDANPDLARAVWEVVRAGNEAIDADHDAYAKFVADTSGAPEDVVLQATLWRYATEPADPEGLATAQSTLDFLLRAGTVPGGFDVQQWVAP